MKKGIKNISAQQEIHHDNVFQIKFNNKQGRWSFLKSEGAIQKLGGRNTQKSPIFNIFWADFWENR